MDYLLNTDIEAYEREKKYAVLNLIINGLPSKLGINENVLELIKKF